MPCDDLDIGARRRCESDQVVAVIVVQLRACIEQEEIDLPVAECIAGRLETGHA